MACADIDLKTCSNGIDQRVLSQRFARMTRMQSSFLFPKYTRILLEMADKLSLETQDHILPTRHVGYVILYFIFLLLQLQKQSKHGNFNTYL